MPGSYFELDIFDWHGTFTVWFRAKNRLGCTSYMGSLEQLIQRWFWVGVIAYVDPTMAHAGYTSKFWFEIDIIYTCDLPSHHHHMWPLKWHLILHIMLHHGPHLGGSLICTLDKLLFWHYMYCLTCISLGRGHNFTPPSISLESCMRWVKYCGHVSNVLSWVA